MELLITNIILVIVLISVTKWYINGGKKDKLNNIKNNIRIKNMKFVNKLYIEDDILYFEDEHGLRTMDYKWLGTPPLERQTTLFLNCCRGFSNFNKTDGYNKYNWNKDLKKHILSLEKYNFDNKDEYLYIKKLLNNCPAFNAQTSNYHR